MVYILYKLDLDGPGIGGPFPEMEAFSTPEKAWEWWLNEVGDKVENYIDPDCTMSDLEDSFKAGYDVQTYDGDDQFYWNLVTLDIDDAYRDVTGEMTSAEKMRLNDYREGVAIGHTIDTSSETMRLDNKLTRMGYIEFVKIGDIYVNRATKKGREFLEE